MTTRQTSTNKWGTAKWIVDSDSSVSTHTTIAAALTAASSGDTIFIRPGTYTENLTLKAGVNLCAYDCDAITPNVTIIGKMTATFAGTCTISGIRLQTNSDFLLVVSGSSATIVYLTNCYLGCTNNTGISFTSSSSSSQIWLLYCRGDLGTTGIAIFVSSSAGLIEFDWCRFDNSGASSTASSASAGVLAARYSLLSIPLSSTSTSYMDIRWCLINSSSTNTIALTCNGSGNLHQIKHNDVRSGSASAISIGASGNATVTINVIQSSASSVLAGTGSLSYGGNVYITNSGKAAGLTKTALTTD